ncbi:major facilitator superfamily domain-containing protein 7-b [Pyronema omphalodes]|nr:major facilitator superfamily domain-containing protein 7-b [Pyronema omphalodes]
MSYSTPSRDIVELDNRQDALLSTTSSSSDYGATQQYKVYKRRWLGVIMLIVMNIVVSWGWLTYAPVSNLSKEWFSLESETPINWLSTIIFFSYVFATPAVVYGLHHYSLKPTLLVAAFLLLVGNWIRYGGTRTQTFPVVMLGQILIGFSQPFVLSAPPHYSDLWFTPSERVSATALVSLANPVGAALAQFFGPMLATTADDISFMVLIVSIIATISVFGWLLFPSSPPTPPSASGSQRKASITETKMVLKNNRNFWLMLVLFSIYLGLFNAFTSLMNQIMYPRGYSPDQAGICGAILILSGLISTAVVSPVIDKTHAYFFAMKVFVPVIGAAYVAFIWAPEGGKILAPYIIGALLGAASFCLMPLALELSVEFTYPVAPEWSSSALWCGGQLMGAILLLAMDRMKDRNGDMGTALIFQGVLAAAVVPGVFLFRKKGELRRLEEDKKIRGGNC